MPVGAAGGFAAALRAEVDAVAAGEAEASGDAALVLAIGEAAGEGLAFFALWILPIVEKALAGGGVGVGLALRRERCSAAGEADASGDGLASVFRRLRRAVGEGEAAALVSAGVAAASFLR